MPKKAKELSALEIKKIKKAGLHAVGGVAGLLLQVSSTGARSWILRTMVGSKRRDIGLGGYPDVPLKQARESARATREKIREGIDPVEERKAIRDQLKATQATLLTFEKAAEKFITQKQVEFRNKKHAAQWTSTINKYANPIIGKLPVSDIDINHLIRVLEPIWLNKTETAKRLRGRIESVLSWATVSGFRTGENPARWKGHLEHVLQAPSKVSKVKHHRALPWQEIGSFMSDLKQREGISAKALEFLILTATRSGEIRGATWDEI
ncbi:MAG: integrase arm-type DNA-binding domain-containing protein, partial [Gammaproteobacteria bacterium]|nr:integrase arm-type DNA-binding domain-containing protein [Gammaproteobacteria bacterium]